MPDSLIPNRIAFCCQFSFFFLSFPPFLPTSTPGARNTFNSSDPFSVPTLKLAEPFSLAVLALQQHLQSALLCQAL